MNYFNDLKLSFSSISDFFSFFNHSQKVLLIRKRKHLVNLIIFSCIRKSFFFAKVERVKILILF